MVLNGAFGGNDTELHSSICGNVVVWYYMLWLLFKIIEWDGRCECPFV